MPTRIVSSLVRAIDARLPRAAFEGGSDHLQRARLVYGLGVTFVVVCVVFAVAHAIFGSLPMVGYSVLCALLVAGAPALVAWGRAPDVAGAYLAGVGLLVVGALAGAAGGLETAGLAWISVPPLLALLVSTRRVAVVLLGLSIGYVLVLGALAGLGVSFHPIPSTLGGAPMLVVVYGLLPLATTAIGWSYATATAELRREVEAARDALVLVLDNVGQGFLLVDRNGRIVGEHSRTLEDWFGPVPAEARVWDYLTHDGEQAWLRLGWEMLGEGLLPVEVCVGQLPASLQRGGRTLGIDYREAEGRYLLVITDVTQSLAARDGEAELHQLARAFDHAVRDPGGFSAFVADVGQHLAALEAPAEDWKRRLHTVKASLGMFGVERLAAACHAIELEGGERPDPAAIADLTARWGAFAAQMSHVRGGVSDLILVSPEGYTRLCAAVEAGVPHAVLGEMLHGLTLEPAGAPLRRAAEYAAVIARSLGKEVEVECVDAGVQVPPDGWAPIWSALPHVVRNAIDHGVEAPEARIAAGKARAGRLRLAMQRTPRGLELAISDDGQGVDWARVAERLAEGQLPTYDQLEEALFRDGFTTRTEVGEWSGRGVGLSAFREAVRSVGGEVEVHSALGCGTTITAVFPHYSLGSPSAGFLTGVEA